MSSGMRRRGPGRSENQVEHRPSTDQRKIQRKPSDSVEEDGVGYAVGAPTESQTELLYRMVSNNILRFCSRIKGLINGFIPAGNPAAGPSRTTDPHSTAALDVLESTQKTQFCPEAEEHEEMLREIWRLLVPGKPFQRISRAWGDVGFQGKDPVTDLRGQGMLGLRNIAHLARTYTEEMRAVIDRDDHSFPLAIAVINVSAFLINMVHGDGRLADSLFSRVGSAAEALHLYDELLAVIFREFEAFHRTSVQAFIAAGGNPALAVMEFNSIRGRFFDQLKTDMTQTGLLGHVERAHHNTTAARGAPTSRPLVPEGQLLDLS